MYTNLLLGLFGPKETLGPFVCIGGIRGYFLLIEPVLLTTNCTNVHQSILRMIWADGNSRAVRVYWWHSWLLFVVRICFANH